MVKTKIVTGNYNTDENSTKGWILGHFMPEGTSFKTQNVKVKWGKHKKGESKIGVGTNDTASSLAILLQGKFRYSFPDEDKEITLEKPGAYVFYESGTAHSWYVEEDCLIITIRWPSVPKDQKVEK